MGHFVITFRLKQDSDYQQRYESLMEKIRDIATDEWDETSSFIAVSSPHKTSSDLCRDLYIGSDFNHTKDKMVVIDLDNRTKATKGDIDYPALLEASLGF